MTRRRPHRAALPVAIALHCAGCTQQPAPAAEAPLREGRAEAVGSAPTAKRADDETLAMADTGAGFDATRAYRTLAELAEFGHRYYGARRRAEALDRLEQHLTRIAPGVQTRRQTFAATEQVSGTTYSLTNLIARIHPERPRRVLLGSHFDTRLWAEEARDPAQRETPIMGANDGTSGVAVVLEAARVVATQPGFEQLGLDVVLFDGEEFGRPGLGDYCRGSEHFAANIRDYYPSTLPVAALVLDMVGDRDLSIRRERTSNAPLSHALNDLVFSNGRRLAPGVFSDAVRSGIIDDHTPLQRLGIPAVLIIDLDYPHWHTPQDTLDKVSTASLAAVGQAVVASLHQLNRMPTSGPALRKP